MISMKFDSATIERGFKTCPGIMARHVKDGLQHVLLGFRKDFWRKTQVHLQPTGKGIQKPRFWPIKVEGGMKLQEIRGNILTGSPAAFIHETGGTIRPTGGRKFLAVPIGLALNKAGKRRPHYTTPLNARAKLGRKFVTVRSRTSGNLVLRQMVKPKGRPKKGSGGMAILGPKMVLGGPAWALVREIQIKPRLRFISIWEGSIPDAERRFGKNLDEAVDEAFKTTGVNLRG